MRVWAFQFCRCITTFVSETKSVNHLLVSQSPASQILLLCKSGCLPDAIVILNSISKVSLLLGVQPVVYASLLQACVKTSSRSMGAMIHSLCIKSGLNSDRFVGNSLLSFYLNLGNITEAHWIFNHLETKDVVSWTSMISVYSKMGRHWDALKLFGFMQDDNVLPNEFTLSIMIKVCCEIGGSRFGGCFHRLMIVQGFSDNCVINSALVDMYGKCGFLENAVKVFDEMPNRDAICWTSIIAAYVQKERYREALGWFVLMQKDGGEFVSDGFAFGTALTACGNLGYLWLGRQLHSRLVVSGIEVNAVIGSALVDMYGKCNDIVMARRLFDQMSQKNMVTWCSMLCGYCENGNGEHVLELFREMEKVGMGRDHYSYGTVLRACTILQALQQGKEIHGRFLRTGGEHGNVIVESALIDMYAECGSIEDALRVFDKCTVRNIIVWNTMISGLAQNGRGKEALEVYDEMVLQGVQPDYITFVGVLFACSHSGMVEKGRRYFKSMVENYGISPGIEHHACMVDLFGRSGALEEAENLILNSRFANDFSLWAALLGSCAAHSNMCLAEQIATRMVELKPKNHLTYILLANVYSAIGQWRDAETMRSLMKDRRIRKTPGKSWIEVQKNMTPYGTSGMSKQKVTVTESENEAWIGMATLYAN